MATTTTSSTHPLSFSSFPIISQTSKPSPSKLATTITTLPAAAFSKNRHFKMEELPSKGIHRRRFVEAGIPFLWAFWNFPEPSKAKEVEVGSYLPQSQNNPSFVVFKASSRDTPALRAGNVQPYEFIIPPTWKQTRIANILSGNYCQPKCAEPWIEVKFENEKQGKVQVVASPLIRLTNKLNASIEDIGSPEKVIAALGPFVTGNSYDPDELITSSIEKRNGQTYYNYVLETPYASTGTHNLAKATAKGSTVVLFVASADDRQWPVSQTILKEIVESFNV